LDYLIERGVEIVFAVVRKRDEGLLNRCIENNIRFGTEEELDSLHDRGMIVANYLFSFYWKLAKKKTIDIALQGSINFHPGPLPEARGSGYHMAILKDWGYWGVTAHYMDETFDTGDIILCKRFDISEDILNIDLVKMTHDKLFDLFVEITDDLLEGKDLSAKSQNDENAKYYSLTDLEAMKNISVDDTTEQINKKIRAFWNPPHSGAQITINGYTYTLINSQVLNWIKNNI